MDLVLGFAFLIPGTLMLYAGVRELIKAKSSNNWPTTTGKIVSSEVYRDIIPKEYRKADNDEKLPSAFENLVSTQASGSRGRPSYEADVFYKYYVNDIEYSSNMVSFGGWISENAKDAQRIVSRYPQGKEVTVHYNQDMPEESILEPGASSGSYFTIVFALVFAAVGFYMLFAL